MEHQKAELNEVSSRWAGFKPMEYEYANTSCSAFPLSRYIFLLPTSATRRYRPHTVAILGLPIKVTSFPIVKALVAYVGHVFAYPRGLFDPTHKSERVKSRVKEPKMRFGGNKGEIIRRWNVFEGLKVFEYTDKLHRLSERPDDWKKVPFGMRWKLREFWHSSLAEGRDGEW
ncbi:monooxygenase [Marasmius crinis-equi]|uniref:Monooxygenase n=1 Tax=Marasmius crinis-equi TaxID=585013 RepID=A0ABR3EZV2_9AGAR